VSDSKLASHFSICARPGATPKVSDFKTLTQMPLHDLMRNLYWWAYPTVEAAHDTHRANYRVSVLG
jgi:hypothetical protein